MPLHVYSTVRRAQLERVDQLHALHEQPSDGAPDRGCGSAGARKRIRLRAGSVAPSRLLGTDRHALARR
jgi:hypothetical protein